MSKKGKQNKNKNHPQANPAREIEALRAAVAAHATESDLEALKSKPPVSPGTSPGGPHRQRSRGAFVARSTTKAVEKGRRKPPRQNRPSSRKPTIASSQNRRRPNSSSPEARAEADKVEKAKWCPRCARKGLAGARRELKQTRARCRCGFHAAQQARPWKAWIKRPKPFETWSQVIVRR